MYTKFTTFILFLFTAYGLQAQEAKPEKLDLSSGGIDYEFKMIAQAHNFELCGLEQGAEYYMYVIDERAAPICSYELAVEGNTDLGINNDFTAKGSCMTVTASRTECRLETSVIHGSIHIYKKFKADEDRLALLTMQTIPTQEVPSVEDLVRKKLLSNTCGDIFNITTNGGALGLFQNGGTNIGRPTANSPFGMDEGIIMSSSPIGSIIGQNSGTGQGFNSGSAGDALLTAVMGVPSQNAAVIEFDFVPVDDFISFDYVFASEEYCDFVFGINNYNDAFGFFISGPGFDGPENIALIPGTTDPVSIKTVNNLVNKEYYVPNISASEDGSSGCSGEEHANACCLNETAFDGFTTVLTAFAPVERCQTYHLKLVVADAVDQLYGSAVFIKAGSFSVGGGLEVELTFNETGSNYVYEGCGDQTGEVRFIRTDVNGTNGQFINMDLNIFGTATKNKDYNLTFNQGISIPPLPPPGIWIEEITILPDTLVEETEWVQIELDVPCECDAIPFEFQIIDVPPMELNGIIDVDYCNTQPVVVSPVVTGGIPEVSIESPPHEYTYLWTGPNGFTSTELQLNHTPPAIPGLYQYTFFAYDDCGNAVTDMVNVTIVGEPAAAILGDGFVCDASPSTDLQVTLSGPGPWDLVYAIDGVEQAPLAATGSPYFLPASVEGEYELVSVSSFGCEGEVSGLGVVSTPVFTLTPDPTNPECAGTNTGSIDLAVEGGTAPYNYAWSDTQTQTTALAEDLPAGAYSVTITDDNGCTDTVSAAIADPPAVTAAASLISEVTCANPTGGAVSVSGDGGTGTFTYEWSNSSTDQNPTGLTDGTYFAVVTDENGCTAETSIVVPADENLPTADATVADELTCTITEVTLGGGISSTGSGFSYEWTAQGGGTVTAGVNSLTPTVAGTGTYQVVVTDDSNGCTSTATVNVTENMTDPNPSALTNDILTCTDLTATLDASASAGQSTLTYDWFDSMMNPVGSGVNVDVMDTGTYTLQITDSANGCTATTTLSVADDILNPTPVASTNDVLTCVDLTASLDGTASTGTSTLIYQWFDSSNNQVGTGSTVDVNTVDTYSLVITDEGNGCSETTTVNVTEEVTLPTPVAVSADLLTCDVDMITLDGSGSTGISTLTYEWFDTNNMSIGTGSTVDVGAVSTYSLVVTNESNGCSETTMVSTDEDVETPTAFAGDDGILTCADEQVGIDGTGSATGALITYEWMNAGGVVVSNELTAQVNSAGDYTLIVTDGSNGCTSTDVLTIATDENTPVADAGIQQTIDCLTPEVTLNGTASSAGMGITYEWLDSGGNIVGTDPTLLTSTADTYTLVVNDSANGCTAQAQVGVLELTDNPVADAGTTQVLTCVDLTVSLDGSNSSSDNDLSYAWSDATGTVFSNTSGASVDQPGMYTLLVIDELNGCEHTSTVEVTQDTATPVADAGQPSIITCVDTDATLDASATTGDNLVYSWTNAGTEISAAVSTVTTEAGTYDLLVTNSVNGCTSTSQVVIPSDVEYPLVDAGNTTNLTCSILDAVLDASASTGGTNLSFAWTDATNTALATDAMTTITEPGIYTVVVTNMDNSCSETGTIEITQDIEEPTALAGDMQTLSCTVESVNLSGLGSSSGGNFTYEWTTASGNILAGADGLSPEVDQPAIYELTVTNTDNDCSSTAMVEIAADENAPTANAGLTAELNCTIEEIQLDGTLSTSGPGIATTWSTADGNILGGESGLTPNINAPGVYTLTVLDNINGCETASSVTITQDITMPTVEAGIAETLNCTLISLNLDATGTSEGTEFSYQWTTTDGTIVSGADGLSPEIDAPGTYELTVSNSANNCVSTDMLTVLEDVEAPMAAIETPQLLTCTNEVFNLSGTGSSTGTDFTYAWTTNDGNILMGADDLSPEIDAAGTYTLLVTNTANNCETTTSQLVEEDTAYPTISIAEPSIITCEFETSVLNGFGSSSGSEFQYEWTTIDGSIDGAVNFSNATATAPGTYTLSILNTTNDCEITEQIVVLDDVEAPLANAGADLEIDCANPSQLTDGSASSQGTEFIYTWSTMDGNVTANPNDVSAEVNQIGTYTLLVTDTSNGCTATDELVVTSDDQTPQAIIQMPEQLDCDTDAITINANATNGDVLNVLWSTSDGNILGDNNTENITVNQPGDYIMTVMNPDNGCSTFESITVTQNLTAPNVDAGTGSELNCTTLEVGLTGTGSTGSDYTYEWTTANGNILTGVNALEAIVDQAGIYDLLITNTTNGCTATDNVEITLNEDVPTAINAEVTPPLCFGDPGTIEVTGIDGGVGPYLYSLNGEDFGDSTVFSDLDDGQNYTVYMIDVNGCTLEQELSIPAVLPVTVDIQPEVEIQIGENEELEAITNIPTDQIQSITWTPSDSLSCTDCLTPTSNATFTTTYTVTVVNEFGCQESAQILFRVDRELDVYIPNAFSPYDENGVNDKFTIFSRDGAITNIKALHVYDRWGNKVFEQRNFPANDATNYGWDGYFGTKKLDPAIYIYWVEVELALGTTEIFSGDVILMK